MKFLGFIFNVGKSGTVCLHHTLLSYGPFMVHSDLSLHAEHVGHCIIQVELD